MTTRRAAEGSASVLTPSERFERLLAWLAAEGRLDVGDAAGRLGVAQETVRRDLRVLESRAMLVRVHGGAVEVEPESLSSPVAGLASTAGVGAVVSEDRALLEALWAELPHRGTLLLGTGRLSLELAQVMVNAPPDDDLTVVTNSLDVASELAGRTGIRLVMIGGIVRRSRELVGPAAETMLGNYHLDLAFIGVDGLSVEGCTTYDEMEATTDAAFLQQARRRVVVADRSKIGKVTFARISPLSGITDLVTDRGALSDALDAIRQSGVSVLTV